MGDEGAATVIGPNQKKLIACKAAQLMIPKGGGLVDGIRAIINHDKPGGLIDCTRQAAKWVADMIQLVKDTDPDACQDSEIICGEILSRLPKSASERLKELVDKAKEKNL